MTQPQPSGYQQLLEENAPDLAAMVGGARAAITDDGALPAKVKTMMMMMSDTTRSQMRNRLDRTQLGL